MVADSRSSVTRSAEVWKPTVSAVDSCSTEEVAVRAAGRTAQEASSESSVPLATHAEGVGAEGGDLEDAAACGDSYAVGERLYGGDVGDAEGCLILLRAGGLMEK